MTTTVLDLDYGFKSQPALPVTNEKPINRILDFKDFHVSFNPSSIDYGCQTTAICLQNHVYLILNGDHRYALAKIADAEGLDGCIEYLINNLDKLNSKSEHLEVAGIMKDVFGLARVSSEVLGETRFNKFVAAVKEQAQAV